MQNKQLTDKIYYVGADDKTIDLFEGQYVVPNGISYNSYVIMDEKIAVMDTVDERKTTEWFENLENVLAGKEPDYLVVLHMEPDHAANIEKFLLKYKNAKIVSNAKTFNMIPQFFEDLDLEEICLVVFSHNERAIRCYNRLGFREYKRETDIARRNNQAIDDIYMRLRR